LVHKETFMTGSSESFQAERLLAEFDEVNAAMAAANTWMASLELRQHQLADLLDAATRPTPAPAQPVAAAPKVVHRGVLFRGELRRMWNFIDIHLFVLRGLWSAVPERRGAMAAAMSCRGTARCYVAEDRQRLFLGKPDGWIRRHSVELSEGWYADTNLSVERMQVLLPVAVRAAGWRWGDDVRVFWRPTPLN
jgi:hypothetical protein